MSQPIEPKAGPAIAATVDEVQGIFPSDAALQDAMGRLTQAGFDRADLSLPQASPSSGQATPEQGAANPDTETDNRQERTLHSSLAGSIGALAAAGVTIATGGVAGVAIAAAAAAGLGAGALANAATSAVHSVQHAGREQAAAAGTLVLSVRIISAERQGRAEMAMREAGATRVEAVTRTNADVNSVAEIPASAGVSSAGWTG